MTEITASMIGAGGLEAEVPGEGEDEAEVLGKEEIGAHLGKAVLREGQRLNSGIGKGNRWNLLTRMTRVTMIMTTTMALQRMENSINTLISSSTDTNMEATNTDPQVAMSGGVQVQVFLLPGLSIFFLAAHHYIYIQVHYHCLQNNFTELETS
ncbi:hypothetical protein U1Q18_008266 [Sarracenia purpurea var. burkii]